MLSKNNYQERLRKMDDKQERFSIRKFSVGAASVLVGTAVLTMQNVQTARADTTSNTTTKTTDLSSEAEEQNKQNAYDKTLNEAQPTTKPADAPVESQDSKVASFSVPKNEGTFVEKTLTPNITEETETETMQDKAELAQVNSEDKSAENNKTNVKEESQTVEANQMDKRSAEANISDTENTLVSNTTLNVPKTTPATTRFSATALSESKFQVNAPRVGQDTPDTQVKKNNYKLVTNATALQQAINTGVAGVNIDRSIDASNVDLAIRNTFTIVGLNDAAALNLGQKSLNNSGNLTLQDIKINGSISGSGTVNIKGNVTSNINSTNSSVPTQDQYNAQNYTGSRTNFKNSNIAARNVNIENGASLTINSSEINDGINLADGGTVKVGDNATLNVNLTNTSTTATRYHVAGVFAKNGGNFISGYKSNVNFNTGLGQAIAIGATRPTSTDADRYGGYGTRSRNDGPTLVQLGDSSTFNFTGRDGIILGNNANFISGENSNVHFENKGRGVALDLANNSNIEISKHSITSFHSVGKTGTSGSFDGYNYIGVNEGGNITVDEYATFRVILEGRGDNPWDDVISLDSRNANTNAAFTSKTGAIVDIRDDNTNFYAELISFPLGSANSRIDIQDPLMLNLQRYSNGGATTGWMATGGDKINTTSAQYTSNLIYMGGNNGVFSVSGGDYDPSNPNSSGFVVYQQIKSDGSKQIWLNVNSVDIPMNGFQTKDIWNNQANPDVSIAGNGLTAGIKANQVHNFDGSPLTGPNAPYYGISTQRASHQIWIPHRTSLEVTGEHKSTIKYVDENGKEIFPENTQSLDMKRSLILDITQDKIQDIQNYALSHTADETLEYIKNSQAVVQDSGWEFTDANGKAVIDPYSTIDSPKLAGYAATIQSTNVSTLKVGEDASAVTAKFMVEPSQDMVQNGELSTAYKQNGTTGIPADYVTVVVYNKQATYQAGKTDSKSVVRDINYLDGKTGKKIPANLIKDNPVSQTVTMHRTEILDNSGKVIGYGTISEDGKSYTLNNDWIIDGNWEAVKSPDLTANGYKTPRFENGDIAKVVPAETVNENTPDTTVNVYYDHNEIPVGPDTPDKHGVDLNELTKDVNETVHYVYSDGTKAAPDVVQTSKWTRTLTIDAVTNEVISDGQYTTDWAIPKGEKTVYDQVDTPVIKGYHADKRQINATVVTQNNIEETVTYQPNGKIIPVDPNGDPIPNVPTPTYPTDPTDPTKVVPDEPVPEIPGLIPSVPTVTPENPGKDTPVPYTPEVPAKDQVAVVNYIDADDNNAIITSSGNLTGKAGEKIDYSTASTIEELENKGYVLVSDGFPAGATFDNDDNTTQIYTVVLKHGTVPVTPENPGKPGEPINPNDPDGPKWPEGTGENGVKRTGTQTIHYEGAGDKTPSDDVQTFDFTKKMLVDKVTGKIIDAGEWNVTSHKFGYKDTPVIEGYHADKRNAGGSVVTPEDLNKEIVVTYQPNGKIIPVDPNGDPIPNVPTPTYPTDPTDPTKVVPDEPVPEIPGLIPSVPTVTPEDPGKDTPVPYTPEVPAKDQVAVVNYIDADDNNAIITSSGNLTGKAGEKIDYSTASTIEELENKGYVLVSDGFPAGATFDNDDNTTQIYTVVLKHGTVPVTPENPGKPGEPINPNDPDGPKWPEGTGENGVKRTGTQTIHYEGAGDKTPGDDVQTFDFTKKMLVDKVTGKIIDAGEWNVTSHKFGYKDTPVIEGYHADKRNAGGSVVTPDDLNKTITVSYQPNGKIIPVDPNGDPIPNVPTPTYPTDPTDPTKVVPDEPVPEIPGLIPSVPTVTPEDPGKDTPVPYTPEVPAKDQVAVVNYIDADDNNAIITSSGNLTGKAGEKIDYSTASTIEELENKGYVLVSDGFPAGATFDNDDNTTQIYTVVLKHGTVPVTPENPGKPGEPINPNDPDGPKWPEGTGENGVKRTGTQTIHYEGAGDKTPGDDVQTFDFTKKMLVDKVTGKIIDAGEWNVTSHTFGYKDTPVIEGYHADKRNAGGSVVTPDDLNKTITVSYQPNGKIIPVDPNGDPIPNVPTPTYPTDPTDPTKVVPDEPVPEIPGLIPSVPTVTPENPGKDTPVPYTPEVPAKDQVAVVNYIDADDNNAIITSSGNLTGKAGEKIDYSTASTIEELENKGYVLVNDGFPAGATFDNDDNTTQIYTVVLKHGTVPVTPENPGKPGEPINPNDPDGPKWPEGTGENGVKRTGTQTIHYEGAGDKTPGDDVQTFDFTKKMLVDKVTGKIIDAGEWNVTSHKFGYKDTPVIEGYHADKRNAGGSVVTPDDLNKTITVSYQPNGKIIPVDPNGDPIPNVPTPTYPTDPTDPTKVVPDEPVPEIPGLIPSVPTVTPENPGKDTSVPYNPVKDPDKVTTVEGKQIIHFVDGDNNKPLKDPNIQTYEFKITNGVPNESSHTFTLVNVPVIPGYVAEIKSAGGKTVTPDKPLAEVTVVYHKIGKIVPVDPNGNPIPNVPTPSYTNDPTDPTKVVPNEPVPAIPGKTPDKTTVTPVDPTKDTPVVYKDDKVPPAPNTQKAVVNFIDVNTGKIISTSGILSGYPGEDINKLFSSAEVIKQLEAAGYEVVYNAFDGDGVIKYFDNDGNTVQQFTIALKLKEKAKTPDPVLPDPEVPVEKETQSEQPVKQNVAVPTPEKPVEKKTTDNKEVLPQTGADSNEAATILGAVATAIGMTSLIGAKRRKKDDK